MLRTRKRKEAETDEKVALPMFSTKNEGFKIREESDEEEEIGIFLLSHKTWR